MAGTTTQFVKRIRDIMRNDPGINGDAQRIEKAGGKGFEGSVFRRRACKTA